MTAHEALVEERGPAAATVAASSALDHLQREVNVVLEHTGRLFAAANQGGGSTAAAQASRFKKIFPDALDKYQKALDELEDELRMASLIMRRDLAVYREKNAIANPAPVPQPEATSPTVDETQPTSNQQGIEPVQSATDEDHPMTDAGQPTEAAKATLNTTTTTSAAISEEANSEETKEKQNPTDSQAATDTDKQPTEPADSKNPSSSLQIDTSNQASAEVADARPQSKDSNKPPDTADAFSANADLDSLFNDTNSAAGGDLTGDGIDFNTAGGSEFDFDSFNTLGDGNNDGGNDLSSLLPGLEQYANNSSHGNDADFSAMFNIDGNGSGTGQNQNQQDLGDVNDGVLEDFTEFVGLGDDNANGNDSGDIDFGFDFS